MSTISARAILRPVMRWSVRVVIGLIALVTLIILIIAASIPYGMLVPFSQGTTGQDGQAVIINNVNVLTMTDGETLTDQFVLIDDGRIISITSRRPDNAEAYLQVDGHGQTLMPGLIDMHTHIFDRTDLVNYLTSGVTTVRNMMGMPMHLRWREQTENGTLAGARMIAASPSLNQGEWAPFHTFVETPDEARDRVRLYHRQGYDFIKVYDGLSGENLAAVVDEATALGLPGAGHPVLALSLDDFLHSGIVSVEHAEDIYHGALDGSNDQDRIVEVADQFAQSGVPLVPTLMAYRNLQRANADMEGFLASVDMERINPVVRFFGDRAISGYDTYPHSDRMARKMDAMTALVARLYEIDGPIVLGTDTAPAYTMAGETVHDEIDMLINAGVNPYSILRSATSYAAEVLNLSTEIGQIAPGLRAELILIDGDPIADISLLRHPTAVFRAGRYYDREALDILENSGRSTMSTYATIGWLLWHEIQR